MIIKNKLLIVYIIFLFFTVFNFFNSFVLTAEADGLWNQISCKESGNCQLRDFAQLTVNVAQWILGISGSLALLAFVYGGVLFLISAGSSERITKAKQAIVGAVVGLVIVMASYMIIGFVFSALGVELKNSSWAQTGWF